MNAASIADAARLPILLTELRLPTLKRMWESIGAQSDREGWNAARLLSTLLDLEMPNVPKGGLPAIAKTLNCRPTSVWKPSTSRRCRCYPRRMCWHLLRAMLGSRKEQTC